MEELVAKLTKNYPVQCIHNPDYASGGMLSSIQCGIRELILSSAAFSQEDQSAAALITLGDQPQIKLETVLAIYSAFKQNGSELVLPSYNNRRGHPWLIARPLWEQLLAQPATMTPRQFLYEHNHQVMYITSDESILQDLDTPDDYLRLQP